MYKCMFRPEGSNCASSDLAKLPSLPRTSEIHHVVISAERSTSAYINLMRCVYHGFTFSLVLGVSPIAIVVCLINILIDSGVLIAIVVCLINILICSGVLRKLGQTVCLVVCLPTLLRGVRGWSL